MKIFSKKETKAEVSPEFREAQREKPVKVKQVLNEWCTIKEIPKEDGESYYFMERAGVDSVAFILFDANKGEECFGLINQYRGQFGVYQKGCYTGSLDKPELTIDQIVIEEVKEEAGYEVTEDNLCFIGHECCGSQSNERVHLYLVNVTGLEQKELEPESIHEENTDNLWMCETELMFCDDWKAKLILLSCKRLEILSRKEQENSGELEVEIDDLKIKDSTIILEASKNPRKSRASQTMKAKVGYDERRFKRLEHILPPSGPTGTIEGELFRAANRIAFDGYNNGFGNDTTQAWNFIKKHGPSNLRKYLTSLETLMQDAWMESFDYDIDNLSSEEEEFLEDQEDMGLEVAYKLLDEVMIYLEKVGESNFQKSEEDMLRY